MIDWGSLLWAALPATFGAILGTWVALWVGDELFQKILAFLMIAVTLWTLWDPLRKAHPRAADSSKTPLVAALAVGFFLLGVYGGFVQAGVGFLILAATSLAGLDLVRGNAVKVLSVLCFTFTLMSLGILPGKTKFIGGSAYVGDGNGIGRTRRCKAYGPQGACLDQERGYGNHHRVRLEALVRRISKIYSLAGTAHQGSSIRYTGCKANSERSPT